MKTIKLTNNQCCNIYHNIQDDMWDLMAAPSYEIKKKRLSYELDKIGGFYDIYYGKENASKNPYNNKKIAPTIVLFPEVKTYLNQIVGDFLNFLETEGGEYETIDWLGTKNSLKNLIKKLNS